MTTHGFSRQVQPLNITEVEHLPDGTSIEYEYFPADFDTIGPMLFSLFQDHWQDLGVGHVVNGSVLELEFESAPQACWMYDGYLTVIAPGWHLHLCIDNNYGGADRLNSPDLTRSRRVTRAALYRQLDTRHQPQNWGIQFWNGDGEKMMSIFLPNPFLGEGEDFLPEYQPDLTKLTVYENLRQIYVLGVLKIPYETNPLARPYLAVCRSSRCNNGRNWQEIYDTLQAQIESANLDVGLMVAGCLQVCKMGPIVFYSGDVGVASQNENRDRNHTWYARVTPDVAREIITEHVVANCPVKRHLYPQNSD